MADLHADARGIGSASGDTVHVEQRSGSVDGDDHDSVFEEEEAIAIPIAEEDTCEGEGDSVDAIATILPDYGDNVPVESSIASKPCEDANAKDISSLQPTNTNYSDTGNCGVPKASPSISLLPKKIPSGPGFLKRRQLPLSKRKLPTSRSISPSAQKYKGTDEGNSTRTISSSPQNGNDFTPLSPDGAPSPDPSDLKKSPLNGELELSLLHQSHHTMLKQKTKFSLASKEKLKKFKPSMARPMLATPSIVSEKRILLHAGPAESLPSGWTIKHYKRTTGLKHTDRYWFSPLLKKKFRSLAQVGRFLDFLQKEDVNGDETKAWELFRTSPPGPDEIRSRNRVPGAPPNLKKKAAGCGILGSTPMENHNSSDGNGIGTSNGSVNGSGGTAYSGQGRGNGIQTRPWRLPLIPSPGLYTIPPPSILQKYKRQQAQDGDSKKNLKQRDNDEKDDGDGDGDDINKNKDDKKGNFKTKNPREAVPRNAPKIELSEHGYITPSVLFDQAIYAAGFTEAKLNASTYKGSSIRRTVDDMFNSDINLEEMELVPKDLWNMDMTKVTTSSKDDPKSGDKYEVTPTMHNYGTEDEVIENEHDRDLRPMEGAIQQPCAKKRRLRREELCDELHKFIEKGQLKRSRYHAFQFDDMIPISLTRKLPEEFKSKQRQYYQEVKRREEVLEVYRKQNEENENAMDEHDNAMDEWRAREDYYKRKKIKAKKAKEAAEAKKEIDEKKKASSEEIEVLSPVAPTVDNEMKQTLESSANVEEIKEKKEEQSQLDTSNQANDSKVEDEEGHLGPEPTPPVLKPLVGIPIVPTPPTLGAKMNGMALPGSKEKPNDDAVTSCITEAKKHLVLHLDPDSFEIHGRYFGLLSNGIADPQYVGPNAPGISGINISGGTGLATTYTGPAAAAERILGKSIITSSESNDNPSSQKKGGKKGSKGSSSKSGSGGSGSGSQSNPGGKAKKARVGPAPTSTNIQLKKIMERGGKAADDMRESIIRAAVYASRTGSHSGSFVGSTGETYPDISKAFSNHAKCRPCFRCKNNKQGAYHCRLKRKHSDVDYDGGNSASILSSLFDVELKDLITPKAKDMEAGKE